MRTAKVARGSPRVLLVMDTSLARLVEAALHHVRCETQTTTDPAETRRILRDWKPHLTIGDLDGHGRLVDTLHRGPTDGAVPLLAFTRKGDAATRIAALGDGVDDVFDLPFTLDELLIRAFALLRRAHGFPAPLIPLIAFGGIEVDVGRERVRVGGGAPLELTPLQHTLLYLLAANAGTTLSREVILKCIWGGRNGTEIGSNVVDRHVRELRVKLGDDWRFPKFLETVSGAGYRFRLVPSVDDGVAAAQ